MNTYGIRQHRKRWVGTPRREGRASRGWRPFVWVIAPIDALKFDSAEDAHAFAREHFVHTDYEVGVILPTVSPPDSLGGTPVAMAVAA